MNSIDERLTFFNPRAEIEKHTTVLPHWEQAGATYFVTFRLADSLPRKQLDKWKLERDAWLDANPKPWSAETEQEFHERFSAMIERWLDACHGSCLLRDHVNAKIVGAALNHFEGIRCAQHAWVVMPNHVHAVFTLLDGHVLEELLHSWKSFTANQIHSVNGESGKLWQRDYFDRLIRDNGHFQNCVRYIRRNPSKARVGQGEFLLWESAWVSDVVR